LAVYSGVDQATVQRATLPRQLLCSLAPVPRTRIRSSGLRCRAGAATVETPAVAVPAPTGGTLVRFGFPKVIKKLHSLYVLCHFTCVHYLNAIFDCLRYDILISTWLFLLDCETKGGAQNSFKLPFRSQTYRCKTCTKYRLPSLELAAVRVGPRYNRQFSLVWTASD
jgi:hypothetical protein